MAGPGPKRKPGDGSSQGGTQWPHLIARSRKHSPNSDKGCGDVEARARWPVPCRSTFRGWAWGGRVSERAGWGGKGVPSLQAMASFPSSTQTAAGTGRGLLLKHWWLQAAGEGWKGEGLMVWPWPGLAPASAGLLGEPTRPREADRLLQALPARLPGRGLAHLSWSLMPGASASSLAASSASSSSSSSGGGPRPELGSEGVLFFSTSAARGRSPSKMATSFSSPSGSSASLGRFGES